MNEFNQLTGPRKWLPVVITLLAIVALGVSSYLTWATWQQSTVAGCTGDTLADCDEVLSSSGSKWLGIPVSLLGAITYVGVLAVVWPAVLRGGWWMTALLTLALMAAGAGVWFIISQAFVVRHFCMYCMTVHVCGLLICTAATWLLRSEAAEPNIEHMRSLFTGTAPEPELAGETALRPVIASVVASIGLAALIGGQMLFAPAGMEVVEDIPLPVPQGLEEVSAETLAAEEEVSRATEPPTVPAPAPDTEQPAQHADSLATDDLFGEPAAETALEVVEDLAGAPAEDLAAESSPAPAERDPVESAPPVSREDDGADVAQRAEPSGEAVVATDEPTAGDGASLPTAGGTDGAAALGGKTFEELFGEGPSDGILPTATSPSATATTGVPRTFRFKYLSQAVDVEESPVLGNPYGTRRLVEMLDYTCSHCRKLHPFVKAAVERYGDQLGIVIYHVPLSRKCNPHVKIEHASHANACDYVRLAYGVWKLAPDKFAEYHDWLMTGDRPPPVYDAKRKAMELAGSEVLTDKSIEIESSRRVGVFSGDLDVLRVGLPALIYDAGIIKGLPNSQEEWFRVLEQRFGMTPRATTPLN